jgi:hypothetical protein
MSGSVFRDRMIILSLDQKIRKSLITPVIHNHALPVALSGYQIGMFDIGISGKQAQQTTET